RRRGRAVPGLPGGVTGAAAVAPAGVTSAASAGVTTAASAGVTSAVPRRRGRLGRLRGGGCRIHRLGRRRGRRCRGRGLGGGRLGGGGRLRRGVAALVRGLVGRRLRGGRVLGLLGRGRRRGRLLRGRGGLLRGLGGHHHLVADADALRERQHLLPVQGQAHELAPDLGRERPPRDLVEAGDVLHRHGAVALVHHHAGGQLG